MQTVSGTLAQINDVVTVGTGLYTGSNGRAEFRVGPNTYRLSAGSRGGFNQLDYGNAVFNLENGSLNVALAQPQQGEVSSVTVDGIRVDLTAPGRYRIDAAGNGGQARVTVFSGQGSVLTGGNAIQCGKRAGFDSGAWLIEHQLRASSERPRSINGHSLATIAIATFSRRAMYRRT